MSTTPADGGDNSSVPVVGEESLGLKGSGFHNSRQFESTPAAERRRSAAPNGGSGWSAPPNGSKSGGGSSQGTGSPEYKQYKGDTVPGGQLTLDFIAAHNNNFPGSKVSLAYLKPNNDPDFQCKGTEPLKKWVFSLVVAMSEQKLRTLLLIKRYQVLIICQMRG